MSKLALKSDKFTPFGGIFSVMENFDRLHHLRMDRQQPYKVMYEQSNACDFSRPRYSMSKHIIRLTQKPTNRTERIAKTSVNKVGWAYTISMNKCLFANTYKISRS